MDDRRYPSQVADKFMLRLEDGIRDQLKILAVRNRRSMNAEINARLAASLDTEKGKAPNA
ncbi:Arc family DNA-binding protein [Burkholderia gladioli]|uniref:Arc family DNA-binding protein n=1 Tax=Burkholderia gladioli TaxID=28095 RepID=UPI001641B426